MHIWIEPSPVMQTTVGVGIGELHAHRVRQADAHRAEAAGVDPAARLVEAVVLRRPHLVLADVGGDVGVAALVTSQSFSTTCCGLITLARSSGTPGSRCLRHSLICAHHGDERLDVGLATPPRGSARSARCSTSLTSPTIGMSTLTRLEIDDGSMSMWMILRSTDAKCFGLPITRSSKRAPIGEQHVAVLHRHVRFVGAVHAEHAEELRVARRVARPGPSACWCTGKPSRSTSSRSSAEALPRIDAAAGVDHRAAWPRAAAAPPS